MTQHISSWTAYTSSIYAEIEKLLASGSISNNDTVWAGSDGSYIIGDAEDAGDAEEANGTEYTDAGSVAEFMTE